MKNTFFLGLVILVAAMSAEAMQITEKDVNGKYMSSGATQDFPIALEIKADKSFHAEVKTPKANKNKSFSGHWKIKDNTLILTSKKDSCGFHYKADLIFSDGASVGNGLECADQKNPKLPFCFCLFEKQELNL